MGFPIQTSPGQSLFSSSPKLFAAFHVFLRLLTPRHPPFALYSLATNFFLFFVLERFGFHKYYFSKINLRTLSLKDRQCLFSFLRKEVIQPLVPQRLPCYDFTPIINHTLGAWPLRRGYPNDFWYNQLSWCDGRCVQGPGTYSP